MASDNRGTLALVQGLHTTTAMMFSNIEPLLPGTENNHEGRAHQRDSFEKRHAFNCYAILDLLLIASSDTLLVSTASSGYSKAALALQKCGPLRRRLLGAGLLIQDDVAGGTWYVQQLQLLHSLMCLDQSGPTPVGQNIYAAFVEPIFDGHSALLKAERLRCTLRDGTGEAHGPLDAPVGEQVDARVGISPDLERIDRREKCIAAFKVQYRRSGLNDHLPVLPSFAKGSAKDLTKKALAAAAREAPAKPKAPAKSKAPKQASGKNGATADGAAPPVEKAKTTQRAAVAAAPPATADTPMQDAHPRAVGRPRQGKKRGLDPGNGSPPDGMPPAPAGAPGLEQAVEPPQVSPVRPAGGGRRRPPTPVARSERPRREKAGQRVKRL